MANAYDEIKEEREYQDKRWGHHADDTHNKPTDYVAYIAHYSTRWFPGGWAPYSAKTVEEFRTSMVKTAAIAVAAIESIDRQRAEQGGAFYEKTREPQND